MKKVILALSVVTLGFSAFASAGSQNYKSGRSPIAVKGAENYIQNTMKDKNLAILIKNDPTFRRQALICALTKNERTALIKRVSLATLSDLDLTLKPEDRRQNRNELQRQQPEFENIKADIGHVDDIEDVYLVKSARSAMCVEIQKQISRFEKASAAVEDARQNKQDAIRSQEIREKAARALLELNTAQ